MSYYHVVCIDTQGNEKTMFFDLDRKALRSKFVRPYKNGKNIFAGGEIIPLSSISRISIICTEAPKEKELEKLRVESAKRIDDFNKNSYFLSVVPDAVTGTRTLLIVAKTPRWTL